MGPEFWWVWVVAGILLIIFEIFTAAFIVMWFGIAAILTAIPVYFGASIEAIIRPMPFPFLFSQCLSAE